MQFSLAALFAATVGLLAWNHYGMERVFELSAAGGSRLQTGDDRVQGGASAATLDQNGKTDQLKIDQPNNDFWFYELDLHRTK